MYSEKNSSEINIKKVVILSVSAIVLVVLIMLSGQIIEINDAGFFQVKQAALSGELTVRFEPGPYYQGFAKITTYKNVATVGFGTHRGEGSADIEAVHVIFNDGSKAKISGLVRIKLPNTAEKAKALKKEFSEGYEHFIRAGIVPIVKNAVKLGANLRSAQDAYTTLALFQQAFDDQLRNGIYVTKSDVKEVKRSTGDIEEMKVTVLVEDSLKNPLRLPNRLQEIGCEVMECIIDPPDFDPKVEEMIAARKDEAMKTELAKQSALRAKQDAITAEEQGKANVAKAKYEKEVEKIKEVTEAEKLFLVAELDAKKALEQKKAIVARGQAEAEANRLKVAAGLTPQEAAEWDYKKTVGVAEQLSGLKFPAFMVIGGGSNNSAINPFDAVGLESFWKLSQRMAQEK